MLIYQSKNILKKYINLIINESRTLDELEKIYADDILIKNADIQYTDAWTELNSLIEILSNYDLNYDSDEKDIKINQIINVLNTLNYKIIGKGQSRLVYSKDDVNFIIKISKKIKETDIYENEYDEQDLKYSESNELEIKTYQNYGKYLPKQDIFPKIYDYDRMDYTWLIAEKVYSFNTHSDIEKIFEPLLTQVEKIKKIITQDITLQNDITFQKFLNLNTTKITPNILLICIIQLITQFSNFYLQKDEKHLFIESIVDNLIIRYFDIESNYNAAQYIKNKLKSTLIKYNIEPTQDIIYINNFLKNGTINDLQFFNIGYRNSSINKKQPWKNFVILDTGEGYIE